jgi:hypothetical protein
MTKTFDLKQFITETIQTLKADGGTPAVLAYLQPFSQDKLTAQKVNGWLKTGNFPFEVAQAIFANEVASAAPPAAAPPVVAKPTPQHRPEPAMVESEPDPSSEWEDETGATKPDIAPGGAQNYALRDPKTGLVHSPVKPARVIGQRAPDIQVREARDPNPAGIEEVEPPVTEIEEAIARGIAIGVNQIRRELGLGAPQNGEPVQENRQPANVRRARQGDNWNTPKKRPLVVQQ